MSYDYDGLVSEITTSRRLAREAELALETLENPSDDYSTKELERLEHLSNSVDKFEVLSKHCPMTPLLWMQNALDTFELMRILKQQEEPDNFTEGSLIELLETRIQLLELGLHEFPGSAILRLHHCEMVMVADKLQPNTDRFRNVLQTSMKLVGSGSHRNESKLIVEFYKLLCQNAVDTMQGGALGDELSRIFLQRAKTPMNEGLNAGLGEHYATIANKLARQATLEEIESLRRLEARHYGFLVTYEDDIDVALQAEAGISLHSGIDQWEEASAKFDSTENVVENILGKWKTILCQDGSSWMGLGGPQTANAFVQYAQACFRYRSPKDHDGLDEETATSIQEQIQGLAVLVFERGVAECPTVDTLWLAYLRRLNYLQQTAEQKSEKIVLITKALGVVERALRNCPYSIDLVKAKLKLVLEMVNEGMIVLDPEELMTKTMVKNCLDNGFVQPEGELCNPTVVVDLFQTLLGLVRNRILTLLAETAQTKTKSKVGKKTITTILKFDEPEPIQAIKADTSDEDELMSDETLQDLEDLCSDLREIYEEADSYLRKNHKKYRPESKNTAVAVTVEEARAVLAKDRAITETHLLAPLLRIFQREDDISDEEQAKDKRTLVEILDHHTKAIKIWQPPHPGTYMSYIEAFCASSSVVSSTISAPTDVLRTLRMTRFLYQKALKSVGNPRKTNPKNPSADTASPSMSLMPDELDYETSLRCLCRNYLLFEKHFGSDHSYSECQKAVQKKVAKAFAQTATVPTTAPSAVATAPIPMDLETENDPISTTIATAKREPIEELEAPPSKRQKQEEPQEPIVKKPTNFKELAELNGRKFSEHKVKVGKTEHRAHPFTVKVTFLSPQTQDMDLVDALRPKCGPVVHAKVMRDKHSFQSKGWALVQFEERESVETALSLSDVLGIQGKSVIIERSHIPAVALVAAHKVKPQGEGRSTKRNMRNKQRFTESKSDSKDESQAKKPPPPASKGSIFAFRPRGVSSKQQRKPKIAVAPTQEAKKGNDNTEK